MYCSRLAENTGRQKVAKNRHLGTIAQLCRAMSSPLTHISTIGKKNLLSSNMSSICPPQYGEFRPMNGWDRFVSLGATHQLSTGFASWQRYCTAFVVGFSQTLRRWIEGATYVRQGDHHVGHWPSFLVNSCDVILNNTCYIFLGMGFRRVSISFTVFPWI